MKPSNYSVWTKAKLRLKLSRLDREIAKLAAGRRFMSHQDSFWASPKNCLTYQEMGEKIKNLDSVRLRVRLALKAPGDRLGGEGHRSAPEA